MKKEKILIIFDAPNADAPDQDYTEDLKKEDWHTECDVIEAVQKLDYPYTVLGIRDQISWIPDTIQKVRPDVIFNLVESFNGIAHYDRDIASYLKLMNVPFTGCGPTGLTLSKNKGLSKKILSFHRIEVPEFRIFHKNKSIRRPKKLQFPLIVKPLREEGSYGISQASYVENDAQLNERLAYIFESLNQDAIAEEYIDGREVYASVLGNERLQVFPLRELRFDQVPEEEPKLATYKAKWDKGYRKKWGIRNQFTAPLAQGLTEKIQATAKKIYRLLSIRGYARLDLRITPEGKIFFIEANPNPILSKWEDFGESADKAGIQYPQLIEKIINLGKASYATSREEEY